MFENKQAPLSLLARLLLASLFVIAGIGKVFGFEGTVGYISSVGLPLPTLGAVIAILVELGGGLLLAIGFQSRLVALVMAIFTLVTAFIFHNYWAMPADKVMVNQIMFLKNLSIAGGLLMVSAFGAGALSLDAKRSS